MESSEATGNVTEACRKAHVGRGTFYYWKPRFDEHGYAGLEEFESRAPKEPYRTPPDIEQKVIALRREHPKWGKKRIAERVVRPPPAVGGLAWISHSAMRLPVQPDQ